MPFFVYDVLRETILTIDVNFFVLPRVTDNINTFRIDFLKHFSSRYEIRSTNAQIIYGWKNVMMTSSNVDIFRVTGPLWGELTGDRWILLTKANDAELWCFF